MHSRRLSSSLALLLLSSSPAFAEAPEPKLHVDMPTVKAALDGKPVTLSADYIFVDDFKDGLALAYRVTPDRGLVKEYLDPTGKAVLSGAPLTQWELNAVKKHGPSGNLEKWFGPDFRNFAFSEGLAVYGVIVSSDAKKADERYGYMDKAGNRVTPPVFYNALRFGKGAAVAVSGDAYNYLIIDRTGKILHTVNGGDFRTSVALFKDGSYNAGMAVPVAVAADPATKTVAVTFQVYNSKGKMKERIETFKTPELTDADYVAAIAIDPSRMTREAGRLFNGDELANANAAYYAKVNAKRDAQAALIEKRAAEIEEREREQRWKDIGDTSKPVRYIIGEIVGETRDLGTTSVSRETERGMTYSKSEVTTIRRSSTRSFLVWQYFNAYEGTAESLLRRRTQGMTAKHRMHVPVDLRGLPGHSVVGTGDAATFLKLHGGTAGNFQAPDDAIIR